MGRNEIDHVKEQIKDMMDMVSNLYYDVLGSRDEFYEDSEEWNKIDNAMDSIRDASDCLDNALTELC
jgi:archaellum component FlaC